MNKLLISLLLVISGFAANAQEGTKKAYIAGSTSTNNVVARNDLEAENLIFTPNRDTTVIPYRIGALTTRPQDNQLYIYLDHWYPFRTSPNTITVENGLIANNDSTVLWGGTLIQNTTINGQSLNSVTFNNVTRFSVVGPVTIADGTQADGLVFGSDASGNGSWGVTRFNTVSITQTSYNVAAGITLVIVNDAGATTTVNLPSASSNKGRMIMIKNQSSTHNVTVTPVAAGDINTAGAKGISGSSELWYISDGSNWYEVMHSYI
jgi:hypothetical protein